MEDWIRFVQQNRLFYSQYGVIQKLYVPIQKLYAPTLALLRKQQQRQQESARPPQWSIPTDPNIPEEFKHKFPVWLPHFSGYTKLENIAICQYLELAKERFENELGPVFKGDLWSEVCEVHRQRYDYPPCERRRSQTLNKIGLRDLPQHR